MQFRTRVGPPKSTSSRLRHASAQACRSEIALRSVLCLMSDRDWPAMLIRAGKKGKVHMYDLRLLKTVAECRTVMERAKRQGNDAVYQDVFRRMCAISGHENDSPDDPLVRDFHSTLAAYEQILTEKNGRNQLAGRTRQKIKNKGIVQSLVDWASSSAETPGFKLLIDAGMPEFTGEYVVVLHRDRFSPEVVAKAQARLDAHGVAVP